MAKTNGTRPYRKGLNELKEKTDAIENRYNTEYAMSRVGHDSLYRGQVMEREKKRLKKEYGEIPLVDRTTMRRNPKEMALTAEDQVFADMADEADYRKTQKERRTKSREQKNVYARGKRPDTKERLKNAFNRTK